MKGSHKITIQNKRIRYDFTLRRNLTVIRGDSATGKTTLVEMVSEYYENGENSAVELKCDKVCVVISGKRWRSQLSELNDSIVFIDEGNEFVMGDEFAHSIRDTDNYYVIITREAVPSLPYSVDEIYGIHNSGKYGTLKKTYNEFYHIYNHSNFSEPVVPKLIITEDSNSGHQFFDNICKDKQSVSCVSAKGKSNIFSVISDYIDEEILIIADGAAFGPEMEKIMLRILQHPNIKLYLPESFEWMILKSILIESKEISEILQHPEDQIESKEYFSWERYFTVLLVSKTKDTYMQYSKKTLNENYLQKKLSDKILHTMEKIEI